uniref:DUF1206 domain-containing protein n=1 Tax=Clavibacter michiganensis TaxID=28447 RepID=UPI00292CB384
RPPATDATSLGCALASLAIAATELRFATVGSSDSSDQTQSLSARVLEAPGVVVLLVVLGLAVVAGGVYFGFKGATKRFRDDLAVPAGSLRRGIHARRGAVSLPQGAALLLAGGVVTRGAVTAPLRPPRRR